jgi:hypothetical protein
MRLSRPALSRANELSSDSARQPAMTTVALLTTTTTTHTKMRMDARRHTSLAMPHRVENDASAGLLRRTNTTETMMHPHQHHHSHQHKHTHTYTHVHIHTRSSTKPALDYKTASQIHQLASKCTRAD